MIYALFRGERPGNAGLSLVHDLRYILAVALLGSGILLASPPGEPAMMCNVSSSANNICPNTTIQLSYSGFGTFCTVTWYTGPNGTGNNLGSANPLTVSPLGTTTYYARPTGSCNCLVEEQITILVNKTFSTAGVATSDTTLICPEYPVELTHSGFVAGSGASIVGWYDGPNGTGNSLGTTNPITVMPDSTTTYFAFSSGTCNDVQAAVTVTVDKTISLGGMAVSDTSELCPGGTFQLSHSGFTPGSGAPSVTWFTASNGGGTALGTSNPLAVSPGLTSTYFAYTSGICNAVQDSVTVTILPAPNADAGPDIAICLGDTVDIGGTPTGTGGSGMLTYSWNPSATLLGPQTANPVAFPGVTTGYTVWVEDAKGCRDTADMTLSVVPYPEVTGIEQADPTGCDIADGQILVQATGSAGSLAYTLLGFGTNDTVRTGLSQRIDGLAAGTYGVEVSYANAPFCPVSHTLPVELSDPPAPDVAFLIAPEEVCQYKDVLFQAMEDSGEVRYFWDFGPSAVPSDQVEPGPHWIAFTEAGTADIALRALRNNCETVLSAQVKVNPIPAIRINGRPVASDTTLSVSSGASFSFEITSIPGASFSWTASPQAGSVENLMASGTASVIRGPLVLPERTRDAMIRYRIVSDANGCRDTAEVILNVLRPLFIPNLVTPNGDGWNDTWEVEVNELEGYRREDFTVEVYSRSGNKVHEGPLFPQWDGEGSPDGAYWYRVTNTRTGEEFSGSLTLLRN